MITAIEHARRRLVAEGRLPETALHYRQSGRHQVVRPSAVYQIRAIDARLAGALQVSFMR